MTNASNLQKTGMQMLLGRERFEALMAEADRVGLSMATVVRIGIDAWMALPDDQRHYEGELRGSRVVDVAGREKLGVLPSADLTASEAPDPLPNAPRLASAFRRAPHNPRPFG